jgi:Mobilization protein NikA
MSDDLDPFTEPPPASEAPAMIHLPPLAPPTGRETGTALGEAIKPRKGRHFGPRPVADPRSARFEMRCTPALLEKARAQAKAAGISVAGYVEGLIDGAAGPRVHRNVTELEKRVAQLRAEMGKSGSNLNQTAKAHNEIRTIAALDGLSAARLAQLDEQGALLRQAIADHREACAAIMVFFGMRPDTTSEDRDY